MAEVLAAFSLAMELGAQARFNQHPTFTLFI
jgi:hypothetical protein